MKQNYRRDYIKAVEREIVRVYISNSGETNTKCAQKRRAANKENLSTENASTGL